MSALEYNAPIKPETLTKEELVEIVERLQYFMYYGEELDEDTDELIEGWDADRETNGGDLVDFAVGIMYEYNLIPTKTGE